MFTARKRLGALALAAILTVGVAPALSACSAESIVKNVTGGKIYASVALQFQADMTQSFDTLVKMQADPKANGQVLIVPQKVVTAKG